MTCHPRPLSAYLFALGMNARPITWPTVPKGKDRVRVCLHAGNTRNDVDKLIDGMLRWASEVIVGRREEKEKGSRLRLQVDGAFVESKL